VRLKHLSRFCVKCLLFPFYCVLLDASSLSIKGKSLLSLFPISITFLLELSFLPYLSKAKCHFTKLHYLVIQSEVKMHSIKKVVLREENQCTETSNTSSIFFLNILTEKLFNWMN